MIKPSSALRMNGNSSSVLMLKLVVLGINFLPLLFSENLSVGRRTRAKGLQRWKHAQNLSLLRWGIRSIKHVWIRSDPTIYAYELVRMGYVVVDNRILISWRNWAGSCGSQTVEQDHVVAKHSNHGIWSTNDEYRYSFKRFSSKCAWNVLTNPWSRSKLYHLVGYWRTAFVVTCSVDIACNLTIYSTTNWNWMHISEYARHWCFSTQFIQLFHRSIKCVTLSLHVVFIF